MLRSPEPHLLPFSHPTQTRCPNLHSQRDTEEGAARENHRGCPNSRTEQSHGSGSFSQQEHTQDGELFQAFQRIRKSRLFLVGSAIFQYWLKHLSTRPGQENPMCGAGPYAMLYLEPTCSVYSVLLSAAVLTHPHRPLPMSHSLRPSSPPPLPGLTPNLYVLLLAAVTPAEFPISLCFSVSSQFLIINMSSRCCHGSPTSPRTPPTFPCSPPTPSNVLSLSTPSGHWEPLPLRDGSATVPGHLCPPRAAPSQGVAGAGMQTLQLPCPQQG